MSSSKEYVMTMVIKQKDVDAIAKAYNVTNNPIIGKPIELPVCGFELGEVILKKTDPLNAKDEARCGYHPDNVHISLTLRALEMSAYENINAACGTRIGMGPLPTEDEESLHSSAGFYSTRPSTPPPAIESTSSLSTRSAAPPPAIRSAAPPPAIKSSAIQTDKPLNPTRRRALHTQTHQPKEKLKTRKPHLILRGLHAIGDAVGIGRSKKTVATTDTNTEKRRLNMSRRLRI